MLAQSAGFCSYVHADDQAERGRIRQLATDLKDAYSLLTGEELEFFIDRDIKWGEEWRARIDGALATTTFFVPVITPRFLHSEECRRELITFAAHAESLGRADLLLSIYWVSVHGVGDGESTDDQVAELVARTQYDDWRELRLESQDSPEYRKRVHALAQRLADIGRNVDQRGEREIARADDDSGNEPGLVEHVAEAEDAFPRLNDTLGELGDAIEEAGAVSESYSPRLERAAARGAGRTLFMLRQLAQELDPVAKRLEALGRQYSAYLLQVDAGVLSLIRMAEMSENPSPEALELLSSISDMRSSADEAVQELGALLSAFEDAAKLSRDLRRPLGMMSAGITAVLDGQTVLQEWDRRAHQICGRDEGINDEPGLE